MSGGVNIDVTMQLELKDLVRQRRTALGLSRIDLAKEAGVGKTAIFDVEHGKETVQLDTLKKLFSALGIGVSFHVAEPRQEQPVTADEEIPVHLL